MNSVTMTVDAEIDLDDLVGNLGSASKDYLARLLKVEGETARAPDGRTFEQIIEAARHVPRAAGTGRPALGSAREGDVMTTDLHLLGHGVDAIVQHDLDRMPPAITAAARVQRYQRAVCIAPPDQWRALRIRFGSIFQIAWSAGLKPDLATWARKFQRIAEACRP